MVSARNKIIAYSKSKNSFKTKDLIKVLGISRQTIASHLSRLVRDGLLLKTGSTRDSTYRARKPTEPPVREQSLKLLKKVTGLEEDQVFAEVSKRMNLKSQLNKNAYSIANYAFSEMLNNAIDHSQSANVKIEVALKNSYFEFRIVDFGVGIFDNVRKGFQLESEFQGAEHVFKGKQTTQPERHSGQGIFFTSRIADSFEIRSHRILVKLDNEKEDTYFGEAKPKKGSDVFFRIRKNTKKNLKPLFDQYSSQEGSFEFDKNVLRVSLLPKELVSRSEARRILMGLEEFKTIVFDFKGVSGIGQAFADEVFRVYQKQNPEKRIIGENMSPVVDFMVRRAQSGN